MTAPDVPRVIFHVTNLMDWIDAQKKGEYRMATPGRNLDQQGFIQGATEGQVVGVANTLYRGARNLVLLVIETRKVKSEIRWEPARVQNPEAQRVASEVKYENPEAAGELFPHIYGPLNADAVAAAIPLGVAFDGRFRFPKDQVDALRL